MSPHAVSWWGWLALRRARRARCALAARDLLAGDPAPARGLLAGWRFACSADLSARVLAQLQAPPRIEPVLRGALLAPEEALPTPPRPEEPSLPHLFREWLAVHAPPLEPGDAPSELAWLLDELGFLGDEIERKERLSWRAKAWSANPTDDRAAAQHWRAWLDGAPWWIRDGWERMVMPSALGAFKGILDLRAVPASRQRRVLSDVREALFHAMLGGGDKAPGWRSVAARVLETPGDAPMGGLEAVLDPKHRLLVGDCAVRRGYGATSARLLFPEARHLRDRGRLVRGLQVEQAVDLHTAMRLLHTWETLGASPQQSWRVIVQNRGRARARLRALVSAAEGPDLAAGLLGVDALAARTRDAVFRFCRDWAWQGLIDGFTLSPDFAPDGRCQPELPEQAALSEEDRRKLVAWVALVVLKGRLPHLIAWSRGAGSSKDTRWGELLSRELPGRLIDAPLPERKHRSYSGVQQTLHAELGEILEELRPQLTQIVALHPEKSLKRRFLAVLDPIWVPDVRSPDVQFSRYRENVIAALAHIDLFPGQS